MEQPTPQPYMRDGRVRMAVITVLSFLALFLLAQAVIAFETIGTVGEGITPQNTITVSGTGNAYANPDIAQVTFDVTSNAATVAAAQTTVTTNMNSILAYLKTQNVADADIQTTGYDINPHYNYVNQPAIVCPLNSYCPQPGGTQVLAGYDVTDSVTLKIRDLTNAGTILAGLGSRNVSDLSGLNFQVDNPTAVNDQAQALAITNAKAEAQTLANQLGVHLVRIVSFSNSNGGLVYYPKAMNAVAAGSTASAPTPPSIPTGQNEVTANVSITYEIK